MITREEEKALEALRILDLEADHEITRDELKGRYLHYAKAYAPGMGNEYDDGEAYRKMKDAYDYLYDHDALLAEVIHNHLHPESATHENSFSVIYEPKQEKKENVENPSMPQQPRLEEVKIPDRVNFLTLLLSFISPIVGILLFATGRKIMPRASRVYLVSGILGFVLTFALMLFI